MTESPNSQSDTHWLFAAREKLFLESHFGSQAKVDTTQIAVNLFLIAVFLLSPRFQPGLEALTLPLASIVGLVTSGSLIRCFIASRRKAKFSEITAVISPEPEQGKRVMVQLNFPSGIQDGAVAKITLEALCYKASTRRDYRGAYNSYHHTWRAVFVRRSIWSSTQSCPISSTNNSPNGDTATTEFDVPKEIKDYPDLAGANTLRGIGWKIKVVVPVTGLNLVASLFSSPRMPSTQLNM